MTEKQVTGTNTTLSGLDGGTEYDVTVRAVDAAGNESGESSVVSFTPYSIVEDGESGSLANYNMDTASWEASTTAPVHSGSYSVKYIGTGYQHIASVAGLNAYPQRGDEFEIYVYRQNYSQLIVFFLVQQDTVWTPDAYGFRIKDTYNDESLQLEKYTASSGNVKLDTVQAPQPLDEWLRLHVVLDDGTLGGSSGDINATLFDASGAVIGRTLSANDTTYTGGGIAFEGNEEGTGASIAVDDWRIL